jgi:predicted metal-dependent HD superfamily phosphohydrolase
MSDDDELRAAWTMAVGSDHDALGALDDVLGRHRQPHRRYHGVRHVTWVVRHVHELAAPCHVSDLGAVLAAAFYHDAVYDPRAGDNEEQSARLAVRVLGDLGWSAERCAVVARFVRATAGHVADGDIDCAVLLDADLAVLGSEPAAYQAYVTGVRAEYGHLDDEQWCTGRSAVLRRLLDRQPLYSTHAGRSRWERRARANIAAEMASLVPPGDESVSGDGAPAP